MLKIRFAGAAGAFAICFSAGIAGAAISGPPIPNFDVHAACRQLSMVPEALSVDVGQSDAIKHCVDAEREAHTELTKEWTRFSSADRNLCVGESKSGSVAPAYSELETCLQMTRDARQLNNQQSGENNQQGSGEAIPSEPPGPTAQNQK